MFFIILFVLNLWSATQRGYVNTITAIVMFVCFILSGNFKTWAIQREMEDKINTYLVRGL